MPITVALRRALSLLNQKDRKRVYFSMFLQICISLIDTLGVILIGVITYTATSIAQNHGVPNAIDRPLQAIGLKDASPNYILGLLGALAIVMFLSKSIMAPLLLRKIIRFLTTRSAEISGELTRNFFVQTLKEIQWETSSRVAFALGSGINATISSTLGSWVVLVAESSLLVMMGLILLFVTPGTTILVLTYFSLIVFILQRWLGKKSTTASKQRYESDIAGGAAIIEMVGSFREVFVGNHGDFYAERFKEIRKRGSAAESTLQIINYLPKYALDAALITGVGLLTIFEFSTKSPATAISTLIFFMSAASRMFPSLIRIQGSANSIRSASSATKYTAELLALMKDRDILTINETDRETNKTSESREDFTPRIEVCDVSFRYSDTDDYILNGITTTIEPGSFVAIVGPTGSGKSTLVDLILGVSKPKSGVLKISGQPPRKAVQLWPGRIGFVPQLVALNACSVRENVAIGLKPEEIDDLKVWEVLERVRLADILRESREGLDTEVGERGLRFSGGQRQRLGLARALFTNPSLLVLDEATSALDSETEQAVSQAIDELGSSVTRITIAHRLATVMHADKVIYLDAGRIIATGTFDEVRSSVPEFDQQAKLLGL